MNGTPTLRLAKRLAANSTRAFERRLPPGSTRWQSTANRTVPRPARNFWTTSRALLFAAFTCSLTYVYGVNDTSTFFRRSDEGPVKKGPPTFATRPELEKAIQELRADFGEDAVSTDDDDLHRHGFSEWSSINIDQLPIAVAYPKNTEEVSRIAKCCHKYRVPMVPYSGGSSLEANFSCPHGTPPQQHRCYASITNPFKAVSALTSHSWTRW